MEFRSFFYKVNFQTNASASAYTETKNVQTDGGSTKVSCAVFGPMQKQQDGTSTSNEGCSIKVNIDFADTTLSDSIIL